ncbi:MAG TPA: helix-turn-helix domain-containing protein [Methylotenera sp.]|nr:helix-turn-helix domain-containing protein [Methylotenera sp.]HPH05622.1 helix-turn-helix domain-containing protein [Methylotenera sp.]HPN01951.1 helix-turn-helix domain-containing protein [Methylotenera sp.]
MKKSKANTVSPEGYRSTCPIANLLDIVGDKWTLLVVRDLLLLNKRRYGEFQNSPEAIPTNILADRLKRLEAAGLVKKQFYQDNPPRAEYFLTPKGADLGPILKAMGKWGKQYIPGVVLPEKFLSPEIME